MNCKCLFILIFGFVTKSFGFFGEIFDTIEELPLRFVSGTCFFLLDRAYNPGEFEVQVMLSGATVDLYSENYVPYDKDPNGLSYKIINLQKLGPGFSKLKFTVGYFGSYYFSPRAWCNRITDQTTTTQPTTTTTGTKTTTTEQPSTTTIVITDSTAGTTTPPPVESTTTTDVITTPATDPITTTTQNPITSPETTTLNTPPVRPTPS